VESVVLIDREAIQKHTQQGKILKSSYQSGSEAVPPIQTLSNLMRLMAMDKMDKEGAYHLQAIKGVDFDNDTVSERFENGKVVKLGRSLKAILTKRFIGERYTGEVYELQNQERRRLLLDERQFYRPDLRAVAIEQLHLLPQQVTRVFLIQDRYSMRHDP